MAGSHNDGGPARIDAAADAGEVSLVVDPGKVGAASQRAPGGDVDAGDSTVGAFVEFEGDPVAGVAADVADGGRDAAGAVPRR